MTYQIASLHPANCGLDSVRNDANDGWPQEATR
jgi:hypothetical protein